MRAEQSFLFVMIAQQRPGHFQEARVGGKTRGRLAECGEFQLEILNQVQIERSLRCGHFTIPAPTFPCSRRVPDADTVAGSLSKKIRFA